MALQKEIKQLREKLGLSQQAFATLAGLSLNAVSNYERFRTPSAKSLLRFLKLSQQYGLADLAQTFQASLEAALGPNEIDLGFTRETKPWVSAVEEILTVLGRTDPGVARLRREILKQHARLLQLARKDSVFAENLGPAGVEELKLKHATLEQLASPDHEMERKLAVYDNLKRRRKPGRAQ